MTAPGGQRVRHLVAKEFRQLLRDPRMRPMLFVSPILQLLLFGYAVNTDVRQTATFVVDRDQSAGSRELVTVLAASGYFQVAGRSSRDQDLVRALDRGTALVGLAIPPGFSRDLAAGHASIQLLIDGSDSNTGLIAQGNALRILQAFAARHAPAGGPAVELRARIWFNPALESRRYNVPAVIGALLMLMCLLLTAMAVVREREAGTLEQLMVTPLRPGELILGKTLPVAAIALVQLALVTAVAILWFEIPLLGSLLALLAGAIVYILAGLSLGLLISTVTRTQQEAFMVMFLCLMPMLILSGFMYPVSSMPDVLQWLTLANPLRHFLVIVRGIFLTGQGVADLWPQYLTLGVMAVVGMRVATTRFARSLG